jgi:hypothetical protein
MASSRTVPFSSAILNWLKPSSFAGSTTSFVGMPWEIYRTSSLTPKHPHPVTLYSKDGGAMGYRSSMLAVDEYGIGAVTLTAGSMSALPLLYGAVVNTFVAAVDEAAWEHAEKNYARTFVSTSHGANSSKVSATFILDEDSLLISALERDGSDILQGLIDIYNMTMGQFAAPITAPFRLFPSVEMDESVTLPGCKNSTVIAEKWSVWPTLDGGASGSDLPGAGFGNDDGCLTWTVGDWVHYGGEPLDRLLFYKDEDGEVVGFEAPFLRSGVLRPE